MRLRLGSARQWHWISSAIGLAGLLFFATTGITLNHSGQLESPLEVRQQEWQLPETLHARLQQQVQQESPETLPEGLQLWLEQQLAISLAEVTPEWTDEGLSLELRLSPRTGLSLRIDAETGKAFGEFATQGWVSFFNDLHTNNHNSVAWSWFIDGFAISCIFFCLSGLLLLKRQAYGRPTTWPFVGLGLLIPLVLLLFFLH